MGVLDKNTNIITKTVNIKQMKSSSKSFLKFQQLGLLIVFIIIFGLSSIFVDKFFAVVNIMNILRNVSIVIIVSCGLTLVMISRGLDLSVGSTIALSSTITAILSTNLGLPWFIAISGGLLVGVIVGLLNAFIINTFDINPILTTLGTMTALRGFAYIFANGLPIPVKDQVIYKLGSALVGPIPVPVLIAIAIVLITYFIQSQTVFGRNIYAIGGSEEASRLYGLKIKKVKYIIYIICGLFSAIAGLILTGRLYSGQPVAGIGMEFDAITAVVVGGTSLSGGVGSVMGTVIGAMILAVIDNIMVLLGISYWWQLVSKGTLIILAIILDQKIRSIRD